jgi:uncharacterized membrane protein
VTGSGAGGAGFDLDGLLSRIQDTDLATAVRENGFIFPWVEAVHVLAVTVVVGSIAVLDLRLLGWASRDRPVSKVLADVLPTTWTAFGLAFVSGALLFSSNALVYAHNSFFRSKLALLVLLGINAAVFHRGPARRSGERDGVPVHPGWARAAGAISIVLWIGVTICGRWIGFTRVSVSP